MSKEENEPQRQTDRVWAVVVTHNRKDCLRTCLRALRHQTHPAAGVVVVNNASTDGTGAMLEAGFPEIEHIYLEENRGGSGGFAVGMERALERGASWVWVMDDDVEPLPDALEQLFAPGLHGRRSTVGLSSLNVSPDGRPQYSHAGWYDLVSMKITPVAAGGEPVTRVAYSSFAGFLIRAEAVEQAGLPRRDFFIWGDDIEYCQRLARLGDIYLVRASRTVHHDAFATARKRARMFSKAWRERPLSQYWRSYYNLRNRLLIVRVHARSAWQRRLGNARGFLKLVRGIAAVLVLDDQKAVRLRWLCQAYWHGVQGRGGKHVDPAQFR